MCSIAVALVMCRIGAALVTDVLDSGGVSDICTIGAALVADV